MSTPSVMLMNSVVLTAVFQPSLGVTISGGQLQLDLTIVTTNQPVTLLFFLESSEDNANFFAECAEEDAGAGVVSMPLVIRQLADNGGTTLTANQTYRFSMPFVRRGPIMRLQAKVTGGNATLTVTTPSGAIAQ